MNYYFDNVFDLFILNSLGAVLSSFLTKVIEFLNTFIIFFFFILGWTLVEGTSSVLLLLSFDIGKVANLLSIIPSFSSGKLNYLYTVWDLTQSAFINLKHLMFLKKNY